MEYNKPILVIAGCFLLCGCATTVANRPIEKTYLKAQAGEKSNEELEEYKALEKTKKDNELEKFANKQLFFSKEDAYRKGYREGIRENVQKFSSEFLGNNFPYYYWEAPLVQRVYLPARIVGGSFIPGHWEYVIIMPGYWKEKFGWPIGNEKSEGKWWEKKLPIPREKGDLK